MLQWGNQLQANWCLDRYPMFKEYHLECDVLYLTNTIINTYWVYWSFLLLAVPSKMWQTWRAMLWWWARVPLTCPEHGFCAGLWELSWCGWQRIRFILLLLKLWMELMKTSLQSSAFLVQKPCKLEKTLPDSSVCSPGLSAFCLQQLQCPISNTPCKWDWKLTETSGYYCDQSNSGN